MKQTTRDILVMENRGLIKESSEEQIRNAIISRLGGQITSLDRSDAILAIEVSNEIAIFFKFMQNKKRVGFTDELIELLGDGTK